MLDNEQNDSSNPNNSQTDNSQNGNHFERQSLDYNESPPLFIDNKKVYYEGFKSLSEEDKARVLTGFLVEMQNAPAIDNLDNLLPTSLREKNQISRDNLQFKLKFWIITIVIGLLIIASIIVMGLFTYTSLDKGLLDENGTFTGIVSTLKEVLQIVFTDTTH